MSYLHIPSAPIPDMSKAIISLWFNVDSGIKQNAPAKPWDFSRFPAPPDKAKGITFTGTSSNAAFCFTDPYGNLDDVLGIFRAAAPALYPFPPVLHANVGAPGVPSLPHDKFNFLLTFGDPNIPYKYRKWESKVISDMDGVLEKVGALGFYELGPPPYKLHYLEFPGGPHAGEPMGNNGEMPCVNIAISDTAENVLGIIPQSFIGITADKEIRVCLQTNTVGNYQGYCCVQTNASSLFATQVFWHFLEEGGGYWEELGPYWAGYEFLYEDKSNELMQQWPDFFMLRGPRVRTSGWHHLLLSFDLSGTVDCVWNPGQGAPFQPVPSCTSSCHAWLALDGRNEFPLQEGYNPPIKLPGGPEDFDAQIDGVVGYGDTVPGFPTQGNYRSVLNLRSPQIVPQNIFVCGKGGNPKDGGLPRAYLSSNATFGDHVDPQAYMGVLTPLMEPATYAAYLATRVNKDVTVPDPKTIFSNPTYGGGPYVIPTNGKPIGIPASQHHVDHIMGVEMAELQIWIGQTLDTSNISNIRLFLDKDGKPAPMGEAEKRFGPPDIKLHGTGNWKQGKNTGTIGIGDNGITKKGGQFTPVAKIESYQPDPQIGTGSKAP